MSTSPSISEAFVVTELADVLASRIRDLNAAYERATTFVHAAFEARARQKHAESRILLNQAMDAEYNETMDVCDALSDLGEEWGVSEEDDRSPEEPPP